MFSVKRILNRTNIWAIIFIIGFCKPVFSQQQDKQLVAYIDSFITAYGIPGAVACLVKTDTAYFGVAGVTKTGGDEKVLITDKMHLGSNTKAVTSFIAMKMVNENKIQLSTKLLELFPEMEAEIREEYKEVTLSELLSHNAGIQPYTSGVAFKKLPSIEGAMDEKRLQFAAHVLNQKPVDKGTYSNAGYIIASMMLERATDTTFEYLIEKTMSDLGLEYYIGFPNRENESYPWGHWKRKGRLVPLPPDHFYRLDNYTTAAGNIAMNIINYSKFIQLHLKGLTGEDNYLKSEEYHTIHFGMKGYSYGWGNSGPKGYSYHDGSGGTYYCHTVVLPNSKKAVIIMTNSAESEQVKGIYALRDIMIKEIGK